MHVPTFPRAMHCLKVESCPPPPRGGGGGDRALLCRPSRHLSTASAPSSRHPAVLSDAVRLFRHVIILVPALASLQVLWSTALTVFYCGPKEANSSQRSFSPQCGPTGALTFVRNPVVGLPSPIFPRDTCCRLLWTISKVHGFDKTKPRHETVCMFLRS